MPTKRDLDIELLLSETAQSHKRSHPPTISIELQNTTITPFQIFDHHH